MMNIVSGRALNPDHHSPEAGGQEERHLHLHGVLHPPGVCQGLVHRDDLHQRGDCQPRGRDPAWTQPAGSHQTEVYSGE